MPVQPTSAAREREQRSGHTPPFPKKNYITHHLAQELRTAAAVEGGRKGGVRGRRGVLPPGTAAAAAALSLSHNPPSLTNFLLSHVQLMNDEEQAMWLAASAGKRNDDVRTCSLSNTEGSTQGTYNGRSTSAGRGGQQQGDGSKSGQQSMEGATQHRNRNTAAAAAQRLDLQSINSREAQPVAGSLRLFLAASHPIRGG